MTAAQQIARWTSSLALDDLPAGVVEDAKLHVLDALGCGLAAHATGVAGEGRAVMSEQAGEQDATVIGLERALPAANAAFANAMLCHGLDFDDTHSDSVSHVSTVIAPAALAAGEARGSHGGEVLAAIVAGNEVVCRVGHGRLGRVSPPRIPPDGDLRCLRRDGLGRAPERPRRGDDDSRAGDRRVVRGRPVRLPRGRDADEADASRLGGPRRSPGSAARVSRSGRTAVVFEGKFGLYHAFLGAEQGEVDLAGQLADLGSRWETPRIAYKPYPVCHFMHGSLGAAGAAVAGRRFAPAEIAEIIVRVPAAGVSLVLDPPEQKKAPRSDYEGKFSLQYSIASLLVRGHVGVSDFTDEAIADPDVLAVAAKVRHETPEFPTYPQAFPGGATIRLADGTTLEADFPYQQGGPENPMSPAEVQAKYRENAALVLSGEAVARLEEAILTLETCDDLASALAPLTLREVARV